MRLWHQSFAQLDKLPAYTAAIREHLDKYLAQPEAASVVKAKGLEPPR